MKTLRMLPRGLSKLISQRATENANVRNKRLNNTKPNKRDLLYKKIMRSYRLFDEKPAERYIEYFDLVLINSIKKI